MLTIWGRNNSINVQKAMWAVAELGLEHQRIDAGGAFGGMDDPAYLAMNPNGRVPTMQDGDTVIWESNAIVRYLCATYSEGDLWPTDPGTRAAADRWMDWQAASLSPDMITIFWGLIRTAEADRDMAAIDAATARINAQMQILEDQLGQQDWVGGAGMTMGDIPIGALVHRWSNLPIDRPDMPSIAAYYQRLSQRPAYAEHVMIPLT